MRILITGAFGQLGHALQSVLSRKSNYELICTGRKIKKGFEGIPLDIRNQVALKEIINTTAPDVLITVPASIFIKVDLPAPFGPKRPKISPSFTSKFKLFNALIVVEPFFEYILLKFFTDKTFFFSILNYKFIT